MISGLLQTLQHGENINYSKESTMWKPIAWLTHLVCAVAAINWGLVRFFNFDIVEYTATTAQMYQLNDILYATIALCGIFSFIALFSSSKRRTVS